MKLRYLKSAVAMLFLLPAMSPFLEAQIPASVAGYTFRGVWNAAPLQAPAEGYEAWNATADFIGSGSLNLRYGAHYAVGQSYAQYLAPGSTTYSYAQVSASAAALTLGISGTNPIFLQFTSPTQGSITIGASPGSSPLGAFTLLPTEADSSTRALVNMSTLFTAAQATPVNFGFVIGGSTQLREILVRAIGPGLSQFGVTNYATEPTYHLSSQSQDVPLGSLFQEGLPGENFSEGWSSTPASQATLSAEAARVGAFTLPSGSLDKADIYLLAPGAYTISIAPSNPATSGVELLEVYEVP